MPNHYVDDLLPHPFRTNLGRIPDPQLKPQLAQQTFEPPRMSAGFHPHKVYSGRGADIVYGIITLINDKQNLVGPRTLSGVGASAAELRLS